MRQHYSLRHNPFKKGQLLFFFLLLFLGVQNVKAQNFITWSATDGLDPQITGTFPGGTVTVTQVDIGNSTDFFSPNNTLLNLNGATNTECFATFGPGADNAPSKKFNFSFSVPVKINELTITDIDKSAWDDSLIFTDITFLSTTSQNCSSSTTSATATTENGSSAEYARWFNSTTSVTSFTVDFVGNTGSSGNDTHARLNWAMKVETCPVVPTPTGSVSQFFCSIDSPTIASLTATGTSIQWYAASTGGAALATTTTLTNGITYYASQTISSCESPTRLAVTATVNTTPSTPTGSSIQVFCATDSPTVADLVATGTAIQWYTASTGGSTLATSTALGNGTSYYASQTISGCESSARFMVTAAITSPTTPTGSASQSFCSIDAPTVANLTATGTAIQWYAASTGGAALATSTALSNGITYYASQTITGGCESPTRFAVTATINTTPSAPTGTAVQPFCTEDGAATVANLVASGTAIQWYTASTGGSILATSTTLVSGTYYASQTVNGCESSTRFSVTVTVASCCRSGATPPKFN